MRILYQHRTLGDGAEGIHIIEIIKALQRLGHEVELFGLPIASSAPDRRSSAVLKVRRATPLAVFELAQFATSGATYLSVRRRIAAFKPDFIYKRHAKYDFGTVLAAQRSRVPLILEVNSVYSGPSLRGHERVSFPMALARTERWIFEHSDRTIAVSTALQREVEAIAPTARAVVMTNGVDQRVFVPDPAAGAAVRKRLNLDVGEIVIGFVGTLWKWHGLELLIEAFTSLKVGDRIRLLIVGDGEMRAQLADMCRQRQLEDRVMFTGRVPHDDVARHVAAMDITVLPAEHRSHASPMKVIEYMAAGKPVVAPRIPNLQEILTDDVDGLLFDQNTPHSMAACLDRLVADADLRRRLGDEARRKVERELNWDSNARKVIQLYQDIDRQQATKKVG